MKKKLLSLALAGSFIAPLALSTSGCHILFDATKRDLQKAGEFPEAMADGTKRDWKNYEKAKGEEPPPEQKAGGLESGQEK